MLWLGETEGSRPRTPLLGLGRPNMPTGQIPLHLLPSSTNLGAQSDLLRDVRRVGRTVMVILPRSPAPYLRASPSRPLPYAVNPTDSPHAAPHFIHPTHQAQASVSILEIRSSRWDRREGRQGDRPASSPRPCSRSN